MAVQFSESKTKENLMRAFAGESQARNRYTIAAERAREDGMYVIADIFLYTAEQERAHADRFYDLLKSLSGETVHIDGTYPVDQQDTLAGLLGAAAHNEKEEADDVYPAFGNVAKEEGFLEAASAFFQIAEIERTHQERYEKLARQIDDNTFYQDTNVRKWMCTNCGYIHEGTQAPALCPVCRHEKGYFIPYEMACYKAEA